MAKKLHFNVSAYTARLIGRENVSNLEGAILELVKNTYDADASKCILYYDKTEDTLYLMDNGSGMTEEVIQKHWMTIGNSSKYTKFITTRGRIQTGAKGIGRFALDRVSDKCVMYTKNSNEENLIEWIVNWNDFDRAQNLTDITAEINYFSNKKVYSEIKINNKDVQELLDENFQKTGTIFKITKLRENWNHDLIEKVRENLSSLIPPDIKNEFNIYLFEDKQTKEEALIISQYIDSYDYKIEFQANINQEVEIKLHRNEFDLGKNIDEIIKDVGFSKEDKEYFLGKKIIIKKTIKELLNMEVEEIGEFHGILYFNKISTNKEDAKKYFYKEIQTRNNYSDVFGGIKIYRDNFRVRPYGEKDSSSYDWLSLGARHSGAGAVGDTKKKWKVAANQISGIVHISRLNEHIEDQANRGGIVETKQFKALKDTVIAIIEEFEKDRHDVAGKFSDYYKKMHPVEGKEAEIRNKAEQERKQKEKDEEEQIKYEESTKQEQQEDKITTRRRKKGPI